MKIKDDHKVQMAFRQGLSDGIMHHIAGLPMNDRFYTLKESNAYTYAATLIDDQYIALWQANKHELDMIELAIKKGDIIPVGWKISRCIESNLFPFIEEI